MDNWHLRFDSKLVQMQARILPPEKIIQGGQASQYNQRTGDFSKEMRAKAMHSARHLDDWILICTRYDEGKARDFLTNLYKVCPPMGMQVRNPKL